MTDILYYFRTFGGFEATANGALRDVITQIPARRSLLHNALQFQQTDCTKPQFARQLLIPNFMEIRTNDLAADNITDGRTWSPQKAFTSSFVKNA
jgi:hypothetical protein